MKTQQTRVTITKTTKTIEDPYERILRSKPTRRKPKKAKKKAPVQLKECTLMINGQQVGKKVKVPALLDFDLIIQKIMNAIGNPYDKFGAEADVDVLERFIFHRANPELSQKYLRYAAGMQ